MNRQRARITCPICGISQLKANVLSHVGSERCMTKLGRRKLSRHGERAYRAGLAFAKAVLGGAS